MSLKNSNILGKLSSFSFFDSFKHASVYFLGTIMVQGLGIISLPVLTFFLTTEEYGIANVYLTYSAMASVLLSLNLEWAISRYFLEPDADKKGFMATIITAITIFFAASGLAIYIYREPISELLNLSPKLISWLLLFTYTNIFWLAYGYIKIIEKKSKNMVIAQVLVQYGKFGAAVFGIWYLMTLGQEGYMGKIIGEFIVNAFAMLVFIYLLWPYFDFKRMRWAHFIYAISYSLPLVPYALGGHLLTSFDQWYINSELGHEKAGLYSFAFKIGMLMYGLLVALQNASVVQYTEWMDAKEYKKVSTQVFSMHKLTILAGLFLILFSVDLGTLLAAKASFREAMNIVPIIVGAYIFNGIAWNYNRVFNYKKQNIYLTVILLTAAALNMYLNIQFVPTYGYQAAAYTTLFSYIIMALLAWLVSDYWLKIPALPLGKIMLTTAPLIFITIGFYILGWQSIGLNWGIISIKILVFGVFGLVLFYSTLRKILGV